MNSFHTAPLDPESARHVALYKVFVQGAQCEGSFARLLACLQVFFTLNLMLWHKHTTQAVPFGTLVAIVVLWCAPADWLRAWSRCSGFAS